MKKIITFYSYKGGAGRSTTTLNTIPFLVEKLGATAERPLLLIDMDLDSAGMTYLLKSDKHFQENYDVKTFLEGQSKWPFKEEEDLSSHALLKHFIKVGKKFGLEEGSVLFLGVNDKMPIDNTQLESGGTRTIMRQIVRLCENNNLPLVFDSSAGEQNSALLVTAVSTEIVCCMRPTTQFRMGTFNYLRRLDDKGTSANLILLPTVVPELDYILEDGSSQKERALNEIRSDAEKFKQGNLKLRTDCIEKYFGINEVQRFKWREGLLYLIEKEKGLRAEDEKEAYKRYKELAELLVNLKKDNNQ